MTEAEAQLRKGLNLLSGAPDDAARQERELNLQIALASHYHDKGTLRAGAGRGLRARRQLCEQLNRPPLIQFLGSQFGFRLVRGELDLAEHHARRVPSTG